MRNALKEKKGFTLIELLAVLIVLGIILVLGITTVLPYLKKSREKTFRIEATEVVNSAKEAFRLLDLNQISLKNNTASCKNENYYCFSVTELIDLGIFDGDKDTFSGTVYYQPNYLDNPLYMLNLNKNYEFILLSTPGESHYESSIGGKWHTSYEECDCSQIDAPGTTVIISPPPTNYYT